MAEKKAEMAAMEMTHKRDTLSWEKEMVQQRTEEEERANRADQMRMERKKVKEAIIASEILSFFFFVYNYYTFSPI